MHVLIAALFVVSGALGVIDEVVFARLLGLHLGHAATAHATVVAVFLAGLGLGYAWLGRDADRLARPLRRYAWLELVIGLWCLAFPSALDTLVAAAPAAWRWQPTRVTVTAALLLPPTVAMGGTLPALVRLLGGGPAAGGRALALLYGFNSAGAVVGGLVAGFWLFERAGVRGALAAAGVGSVAVAALAWAVDRWAPAARPEPTGASAARDATSEQGPTSTAASTSAAVGTRRPPAPPLWVAWICAALVGLASLVAQTLWFRVFGVVLGSSAYAFALVIAAFIAGLTVGTAGARRLMRAEAVRPGWIAAAALLAAALLLAVSPAHERLPWWLARLRFWLQPETFEAWQVARLGLIAALVAVPTAAMGLVLPLCARLGMREGAVASGGARVFAWNTVGSVVGAALGGTVLVPAVGLHGALLVAVGLLCAAAAVGLVAERALEADRGDPSPGDPRARRRARGLWRAGVVATALVAAWAALDPGPWDARLLGAGSFRRRPRPVPTWDAWRARLQRERVVFATDGPDASVAVLERGGDRVLKVNGKPDASSRGDMLTQVASAWVPAVVARRAERVLIIGLGSGVTAGVARTFAPVVDVVEISPAVIAAARHFGPWNHGVVDDPSVRLHRDDARAWLAHTDARWDVIISEPSNPWVAGNGALFTREFFALVQAHLRPGGVLAQWFHAYEMNDALVELVLRTVSERFAHVSLWTLFPGDLLMIASDTPQALDLPRARARLQRARTPQAAGDLSRVELQDLAGLLSLQAMTPEAMRRRFAAGGGEIHVDDRPLLELRAPRALFAGERSHAVARADQRQGWPPEPGTPLASALGDEAVPLTTLRGLTRLHVRFPTAPPGFRHGLLRTLSRRERDANWLRDLTFTYSREGPPADARAARDRLLRAAPHDPQALRAAAAVARRLGEDGRPWLRRCVHLGDTANGRCLHELKRWQTRPGPANLPTAAPPEPAKR